ncbi:MAG: single-stranded DNA-binding protein [Patescibacteria group bacterium]
MAIRYYLEFGAWYLEFSNHMDLNKAMIIGRLTRDPEVRTTPQGVTVCSFGVATNFIWTDQQGQRQKKVEYHNIVTWRKLAEICSQYLKKASKVYIEGRLQTREWQGQDSIKRQRTEIVADNMIMLDSPPASSSGSSFNVPQQETSSSSASGQPGGPQEPTVEPVGEEQNVSKPAPSTVSPKKEGVRVEDIPF